MVDRYGRVKLTNPDKVLYPATGGRQKAVTKAQVFDYYIDIAEAMLPHIAGRPATRKRWPNGVHEASFFEKQLASSAPDWLNRASITHRSGTTTYPIIETVEALAWIAPAGRAGSARAAVAVRRAGVVGRAKMQCVPDPPPAWCSTWTPARA